MEFSVLNAACGWSLVVPAQSFLREGLYSGILGRSLKYRDGVWLDKVRTRA